MFVTSKSTHFTTFLISIAFYVNTYASANRTCGFFLAFRRNFICKGFRIRGLLQCLYFFDIHDYSRVKPVKIPKPVSVLNTKVIF